MCHLVPRRFTLVVGVFLLMFVGSTLAHLPTTQAQVVAQRCFPETGYCISGRMLEFWEQNGGLTAFGFPITRQQQETIEGRELQVQWFERNRLELHPENERPYDVLLGRLGGPTVEQLGPQARQEPRAGCRYFAETGFNVCDAILTTWRASGIELDGQPGSSEAESLALWGLPLTGEVEQTLSDGNTYTVQWFERARFERHPANPPPYNILPGLLGVEVKQPQLPGEDAAIVAAIREYIGTPPEFIVDDICVDDTWAFAALIPVPPFVADAIAAVLNKPADTWTVMYAGPGMTLVSESQRESIGIPTDFACLSPPDIP